ncbi:family 16 glycosylhydrolase [Paraglaciecola arctica]|nr:family 16 glycosylhydrolase [Paraglaciecola arctica]
MKMIKYTFLFILLNVFIGASGSTSALSLLPASDPDNHGGWRLNSQVSDEFNSDTIDTNKWYVQGTNEKFYIWKGRAPSQFAPHNVRLEDGHLKLTTRWQPDYDFLGVPPPKQNVSKYENITTAAVISHNTFLYGYMEVRVKIPDAAMTGAFWGTGYQQELDVFELIGRVKTGNRNPETTFVTSIHDWRPGHPKKNKVWKHAHKMTGRTADEFHVYGVEWLPDGLKMYLDGKLVHHATQQEMGDNWVLNNPLELWFDSEVFPWHGIPDEGELPVDFEIDYVRVWQKPNTNLVDRAFFGFEGPINVASTRKPTLRNKTAEFWWMDADSAKFFSVTDFDQYKFSTGRKSLRYNQPQGSTRKEVSVFAPYGSVNIPSGEFELSFNIWIDPDNAIKDLRFMLEDPWLEIPPIELVKVAKGQWVRVSQSFSRTSSSNSKDRLRIVVLPQEASNGNRLFYIDDIAITKK